MKAIVDVHPDDPEFDYRFISDELEPAGHLASENWVHRPPRLSWSGVPADEVQRPRGQKSGRGPGAPEIAKGQPFSRGPSRKLDNIIGVAGRSAGENVRKPKAQARPISRCDMLRDAGCSVCWSKLRKEAIMAEPDSGLSGKNRSRLGGGTIASLIGIGLLLVFIIQNTERIRLHFLVWHFTWPLWLYTVVTAVFGALVWFGLGVMRRHRRRKERRDERRG